jgi:aminoglycoside 3-N-acetyltransferase
MFRRTLLALIPDRWTPRAREIVIRFQQHRLKSKPKITDIQFRRILQQDLGIRKGECVFIHSSSNKMNLDFPVHRIFGILRDVVGREGTLVFPSWNQEHEGVFDIRFTPTNMGLIPELARRIPEAIRSLHPLNSMLAWGPLAEPLTRDHAKSKAPLDENSPLHKLATTGGKVIGLGVTSYNLSLIHCPESLWLDKFPFPRFSSRTHFLPIIDYQGLTRQVELYEAVPDEAIPSRNIHAYIARYFRPHIVADFRFAGVDFFVCDAQRFLQKADELMRRGITMYGRTKAC